MFDNSELYPSIEQQRHDEAIKRALQEVLDQKARQRARQDAEYAEFCKRRRAPKPKRKSDK